MKIEITEFRDIKFGEPSTKVRPLNTTPDGILWCDKKEEQKIGLVLVSQIMYGFYKGKFMTGRVKFGSLEVYEIFLRALTEKYGTPNEVKSMSGVAKGWKLGDASIILYLDPLAQVNEGSLIYNYDPLIDEYTSETTNKKKEEIKMKVHAAKFDL